MQKLSRRSTARRLAFNDEGQALVLTCLGLVFLLLMAGLGVDVGYLRYQRHQMQKAADAGALAGASVLTYVNDNARITNAAVKDAKANGFESGTNNILVTVNHPPTSGPFADNDAYVEVYVEQPRPTFFMKVMGHTSASVRARAVGSSKADNSGCIYALDPHNAKTFLVDGNVKVASTCGIYVDSDNANAAWMNGTSGCVNASGSGNGIGVVGGDNNGSGSCPNGLRFAPDPTNGIAPVSDPYAGLAAPTFNPSHCDYTNFSTTGGTLVGNKTYCGGITISGSGTVNFGAGLYILYGGGLKVTGSPHLNGTNLTFYNTGSGLAGVRAYGPISIAGSAVVNFSAPLDANNAYAGILFFQDRNYKSVKPTDVSTVTGSNGSTFVGAMYFPGTPLKYAGTPGLHSSTVLVAWQLEFTGDTTIDDDFLNDGSSPLKAASLAE